MKPEYLFLLISLPFLVFLLYQEWKREKNRILRILALSISFLGVWGFLFTFPLPWRNPSQPSPAQKAYLITKGYNPSSLPLGKGFPLYTLDSEIYKKNPGIKWIHGLRAIRDPNSFPQSLTILGFGLDTRQYEELNSIPLKIIPPIIPEGVQQVHWPEVLLLGRTFWIQGKINQSNLGRIRVQLKDQGRILDSISISRQGISPFELTFTPKANGPVVDSLYILNDQDTLEKEPIPYLVYKSDPLKIGVLNSSPGFETRFLENWLKEKSISVWSKTQVSPERYHTHIPVKENSRVSDLKDQIPGLDILVTDITALKNLDHQASDLIKRGISKMGMGLIILEDSIPKESLWFNQDFRISGKKKDTNARSPAFFSNSTFKTQATLSMPHYFTPSMEMESLVQDKKGNILAGMVLYGRGKILGTCILNSYSWKLHGDNQDFNAYWSYLINQSLKTRDAKLQYWTSGRFPETGKEISLNTLVSEGGGITASEMQSQIQEIPFNPFRFKRQFWTNKTGWLGVEKGNDSSLLYIYSGKDWENIRDLNRLEENQHFIAGKFVHSEKTAQIFTYTHENIPKFYFFLLFLISSAYLWIENKGFSSNT